MRLSVVACLSWLILAAPLAVAGPVDNRVVVWGGTPAQGGPYGPPANVINLFTSTGTFGAPNVLSPPGWVVTYTPNSQFLQLLSVDHTPASPVWLQSFLAPGAGTSVDFAWQSTVWDYSTGTPGAISFGAHQASTSSIFPTPLGAGAYAANGGPVGFVAPVPEPSSALIGALGVGILGLMRRRSAALP